LSMVISDIGSAGAGMLVVKWRGSNARFAFADLMK